MIDEKFAPMSESIGKCATCDNDRTGAHPQCEECRNADDKNHEYVVLTGSNVYHKPAWRYNKYLYREYLTTKCGAGSGLNSVCTLVENEQRNIFNKKPCKRCYS